MSDNTAGKVEYLLRANDGKIEADLIKANKKVEKAAEKAADATVKIEEEKTHDIQKESEKVVKSAEDAAEDVTDAWKDAGKEAKEALSGIVADEDVEISVDVKAETDKAKEAIESVSRNKSIDVDANTSNAESKIDRISRDKNIDCKVDADVSGAKADIEKLGDVGKEAAGKISGELETALGNIGGVAKDSFADAATGAIPFGDKIAGLTTGLSGTAAMALGLGGAFVGVGIKSVGVANDMQTAMNQFAAETGASKEETERYQEVLEDIYANNYGESFTDIADAMGTVKQNLGELDDESLQNVTESAFVLRDTFGYDITDSTRAAKAMMDNFGISGEEAMNLIAAGAQNGLDYSGELLDSISEYSVQFEKIGFDADDMFKIMEKGAESGAFNLDKVGDAVKEFSIRVIDGSETTKEGFESIGLNADDMAAKFAAGGDTAKEAFQETMDALARMKDPIEQNKAGVELFGTMWEDLGVDAVTALSEIEDGAYSAGDELEKMKDIKYDDLGSMLESLSRAFELLLLPLGEALMPILMTLIESVLPIITELLAPLLELIGELIEPLLELVSEALEPLIETFKLLMDEILAPLIELLQEILMPIFSAVMDVIGSVVEDIIVGKVMPIFKDFIGFIKDVFTGDWEGAWEHIKNIFKTIFGDGISGAWSGIKQTFSGIVDFIAGIFTGDWKRAWNGVKDIFGGIWNAIKSLLKSPINWIIDKLNIFLGGLNKIKIPDWVPGIGGKGFNIPKIPKLKVGMDYVPADDFPALLHAGEMVLTKEDASMLRSLGGLKGVSGLLEMETMSDLNTEGTINIDYEKITNGILRGLSGISVRHVTELDGKMIADSATPFIDKNLYSAAEMSRRFG